MSEPASLPSSQKAEQALLGILLFDNHAIERIPDFFRADHMHDPVHARLCGAILQAVHAGGGVDLITLGERFSDDEAFEQMGGFGYLADLVDHAPAGTMAGDFCHLISDLAIRRELIRLSDEIAAGAHGDRETPALAQVDELERKLYALSTFRTETGPKAFSDSLAAALERAAAGYMRDGGMSGLSSGLMDLDNKLGGFAPSQLIILAARPSMGKTALATNIAFHNARTYVAEHQDDGTIKAAKGGVTAFFSLEMAAEELAMRILADVSGINSERIEKGEIDANEFGQLRDAALEIQDAPLYIDETGAISIAAIATRARRLKRTVGLDLLVVDYLQMITSGQDKHMSPQERVSYVTQQLKALAKELGIPIIALSQLTRNVETRPDKRPQLSDLRESGAIEQDADLVLFVYRHIYYLEREVPKEGSMEHLKWEEECEKVRNVAEIIIGKRRGGSIGTVKVAFKGETTKFSDLAREDRYPS